MWNRLAPLGLSFVLSGCLPSGCSAPLSSDAGFVPGVTDVTDTPCQSERRTLSWSEETPLGFPASRLRTMLEGFHSQNVRWTNNTHGAIEASFVDLRASFVDERTSGGFAPGSNALICTDYVQIDATLLMGTTDGVLINIERPITLRAYAAEEAFGELSLDAYTFEGSFEPATLAGTCFRRLHMKMLVTEAGFAGSFTQEHSRGVCELPDIGTEKQLLVGHWGERWQSY